MSMSIPIIVFTCQCIFHILKTVLTRTRCSGGQKWNPGRTSTTTTTTTTTNTHRSTRGILYHHGCHWTLSGCITKTHAYKSIIWTYKIYQNLLSSWGSQEMKYSPGKAMPFAWCWQCSWLRFHCPTSTSAGRTTMPQWNETLGNPRR